MLELLDDCERLQEVAGIKITMDDITTFQDQATKPFIAQLKENISSRFLSCSEVVSAMSIFDPRKAPKKTHMLSVSMERKQFAHFWHTMVTRNQQ